MLVTSPCNLELMASNTATVSAVTADDEASAPPALPTQTKGAFTSNNQRVKSALSIEIPNVTLADRLGGDLKLEQLVDLFYAKVLADDRISKFFDDMSMFKLKCHQYEMIKYAFSKGTFWYSSKGIKEAHKSVFDGGLSEQHFDVFLGHFKDALNEVQVGQELTEEAMAVVEPLRRVFKEEADAEHPAQRGEQPMCMGRMMAELENPCSPSTQSLFQRLGGKDAVLAAVDQFYERVIADDRVNYFFDGVNMYRLKSHQFDFMRYVFSHGQFQYMGKGVKEAHQRLFAKGLNESHFQIIAEHFIDTLKALGVNQDLIDEAAAIAFFPFT